MSSGLQFQDFGLGDSDSPFTSVNSNLDARETTRDSANLVDGTETQSTGNKHHFLSFKFYQQYFDVDTEQVYTRILNSAFPRNGCNFIRDQLQPFPDLYGPFWICVTLIFSAAIFANFAHYIESLGENLYENDFKLVTGISTIIASYVLLVPLAIYITLYYRNSVQQYSYIELVALYGYSLAIFIPVSILWVVHYQWFRWSLIAVSVLFSGFVLANTIWDSIKTDPNKLVALGLVAGVVLMHAFLAIGIKEFYFDTMLPVKDDQLAPKALPLAATTLPIPANNSHQAPKSDALQGPLEVILPPSKSPDKTKTAEPVKPNIRLSPKSSESKPDDKSKDKVDQKAETEVKKKEPVADNDKKDVKT